MYYGEFRDWDDVVGNFGINETDQDKLVLFAAYDTPSYEGYAMVVYVQNGKFYLADGSHCSCFGLEDQWKPEEMPLKALLKMADEGLGMLNDYNLEFRNSLRIVQELKIEGLAPRDAQTLLKLALA